MSVLTPLLTPPHWHPLPPSLPSPLFSLTSRAYCVTACLFFSTEVVATRAYKLSACAECRPQHGGEKIQITKCKCSTILLCWYCIVAACSGFSAALTPDRLNKTDPGLPSSVPVAKKRKKKGGEWNTGRRKERRGVKLLYWPENQCKQSVPGPQPSSCSSQWEAQAGLVCWLQV